MNEVIEDYLNESAKLTISADAMLAYMSLTPWADDEIPDPLSTLDVVYALKISSNTPV